MERDGAYRFSLNFKENESIKQIHFPPRKKYFVANLKPPVRIETQIEKWNDYDKIQELSIFFQKLVAEDERGVGLKEIAKVTDKRGFEKDTTSYKHQKNTYHNEYSFYDKVKKRSSIRRTNNESTKD